MEAVVQGIVNYVQDFYRTVGGRLAIQVENNDPKQNIHPLQKKQATQHKIQLQSVETDCNCQIENKKEKKRKGLGCEGGFFFLNCVMV